MTRRRVLLLFSCCLLSVAGTYSVRPKIGRPCSSKALGEGQCLRFNDCPNAVELKSRGELENCFRTRKVHLVCCPETNVDDPMVDGGEQLPHPRAVKIVEGQASPPLTRPNNVGCTPEILAELTGESTLSDARTSLRKCFEYAKAVYVEVRFPTVAGNYITKCLEDCSVPSKPLVVGGDKSKEKELPHMTALGYGDEPDTDWNCGGSLISERFVLTAAHCLRTVNGKELKWARLGDLNLKNASDDAHAETVSISKMLKHPDFRYGSLYNDIALLELSRRVHFNAHIRPACLHHGANLPLNSVLVVSGWGLLQYDDMVGSDNLMNAEVLLQSAQRCRDFTRYATTKLTQGFDNASMICAANPKDHKDTCQGDSGGPLQARLSSTPSCTLSIVGVTSFGSRACAGSPAVYTRVAHFVPWIESIVWGSTSA